VAAERARLLGVNHVAIEVDDVEAALEFYGRFFEFTLRGKSRYAAFIDMGDQFIAIARGRTQPPDAGRHIGLVVDGKERVRAALEAAGIEVSRPPSLDFRDPWGNHMQVVDYRDVQFTKTPEVLKAMGVEAPEKSPRALAELRAKGVYT
jgi:predicted enzyme related to lactoylglutathione lyase